MGKKWTIEYVVIEQGKPKRVTITNGQVRVIRFVPRKTDAPVQFAQVK